MKVRGDFSDAILERLQHKADDELLYAVDLESPLVADVRVLCGLNA